MKDTSDTVYTVAFRGDEFLMVWNPRRNGWEMPGGHVKEGETCAEGAEREYIEESGYSVDIVSIRDLGHCRVCAAVLGEEVFREHEMKVGFFSELPAELAFSGEEYLDTVAWAENAVRKHRSEHYVRVSVQAFSVRFQEEGEGAIPSLYSNSTPLSSTRFAPWTPTTQSTA